MLNAEGKVTGDADFIFYNNLSAAGGSVKLNPGHQHAVVHFALEQIPDTIQKIAITMVIDGSDTISGLAQLKLSAESQATFFVDLNGRTEKAVIMGEVYRYQGNWKLRALGQGFNGGLEPLAVSYGVDVEPAAEVVPQPARISLEKKLEGKAPALISLAKKASISLAKHKLDTVEARVAFVLDASGSMTGQFKKGHVQAVLDRIAVLSVQFDDDGTMDVWGFAERHKKYPDVTLDNLDGYIAAIQNTGKRSAWEILPGLGGTNNEPPVMNEVIDYFKESTLPVFVVCITDGGICKTREIKEAIRRSANYPVFWKFVGLGGSNYGILERLDTFSDRRVDNSNFFAIDNFAHIKDEELYEKLLEEFKDWLGLAKKEGII
ncbi:tellurium resistance protein TerF (plasmid) [Klebsiella pneumoniae]|uniref:Phage inhibition, colicin resistance and tellurite resistance protein n=15 Tax=Klebsiella pneumoniae TaxID=573 RepID=A0A2U8T2C0_KLEPN|nr:putative phage inhibition, colicin resistance and tellurite resistance protein [Klebsiella pneumoniae]AWM64264.1 Putative phage inhibition, colicin resistance and tellurite resistance protein [Klebsiella pneumoniae]QEQ69786.1 putative phage inhibition, colicin resistance and tellurite resistance protein [Klebsiella pneumoniae]QEQ70518.1 putative phage inhibition, colicin resistance and tellurite resistance protein [Klebsiella pneumoniae]QIQ13637.1 putative phage inhibition, colicin resistanc